MAATATRFENCTACRKKLCHYCCKFLAKLFDGDVACCDIGRGIVAIPFLTFELPLVHYS